LLVWLFPVALLLAQAGGLAHGVAHALSDAPTKDRIVASGICDQCASFAKLAHVAVDLRMVGVLPPTTVAISREAAYGYVARAVVPYLSRGPPVLL